MGFPSWNLPRVPRFIPLINNLGDNDSVMAPRFEPASSEIESFSFFRLFSALRCFSCSVTASSGDKNCISDPSSVEGQSVVNCNRKYCTIQRQELIVSWTFKFECQMALIFYENYCVAPSDRQPRGKAAVGAERFQRNRLPFSGGIADKWQRKYLPDSQHLSEEVLFRVV